MSYILVCRYTCRTRSGSSHESAVKTDWCHPSLQLKMTIRALKVANLPIPSSLRIHFALFHNSTLCDPFLFRRSRDDSPRSTRRLSVYPPGLSLQLLDITRVSAGECGGANDIGSGCRWALE